MATMQDMGWGPPGLSRTTPVVVAGQTWHFNPAVAPIFQAFYSELAPLRLRDKKPPLSSSGAYNKRYISGTTVWSNHSWGTAGDANAATNAYGYTVTEDMPAEMDELCAYYGLRWGWNYSGKKDGMHTEFMGSPADAQRRVEGIRIQPGDRVVKLGMFGADVRWLQGFVGEYRDGTYGPLTQGKVAKRQGELGLSPDGEPGPLTWVAFKASLAPAPTPTPTPAPATLPGSFEESDVYVYTDPRGTGSIRLRDAGQVVVFADIADVNAYLSRGVPNLGVLTAEHCARLEAAATKVDDVDDEVAAEVASAATRAFPA